MTTDRNQLAQRIRRGREAVARARLNGRVDARWERRLAELEAQETALLTAELLASRGWCLWRCLRLDGRTVSVARDEKVVGPPAEVAVFTEAEIKELFSRPVSDRLLRLVLEAKKLAGARVLRREVKKHGQRPEER